MEPKLKLDESAAQRIALPSGLFFWGEGGGGGGAGLGFIVPLRLSR